MFMVVAAHPDDEAIGAGALLRRVEAVVLFATDGAPRDGALVPAPYRGRHGLYARTRRREARAALGPSVRVERLGAVDQEAALAMAPLARKIARRIAALRPEAVVTHPYEGGHPDHDAVAFAVRAALARVASPPPLFEMTSYHRGPAGLETGVFLEGDAGAEVRVLTPDEREGKRRMLRCYASQAAVLAPFSCEIERLRPARPVDFAAPPHPGPLWYETLGWPITGERWRALAARAARELHLC